MAHPDGAPQERPHGISSFSNSSVEDVVAAGLDIRPWCMSCSFTLWQAAP